MDVAKERKVIDSLKGIAILGIILVHSGCGFPGILGGIVFNGARGVQLMFLVNGYLIFKSLDHAESKGLTLGQWYKGKIIRIIPLYWFFTILHLLVFGTGHSYWIGPLEKVSWLNIICNLFCLHGFCPYYINSININWFIADLAIWYLIAPLCHKFLNSLERIIGALLIIVPIDYSLLTLLEKHPLISNEAIWKDYVSILCFPAEFPIILLGCAIYLLYNQIRGKIHKQTSYAGCFFALINLLLMLIGSSKFSIYSNIFTYGTCFAVIMISQLSNPIPILDNLLLAFLGKHSYGIYLSHLFVINLINTYAGKKFIQVGVIGQVERFLFICISSLTISVCAEGLYGLLTTKIMEHKSFKA